MEDKASGRQLRVLVFTALLAPIAGLPAIAGRGPLSWLAPILAMPLVVLGVALLRRLGPAGLGTALRERWGWFGSATALVYYLWAGALAALTVGSCVDRLGRTDYAQLDPWLLSLALGVVTWYLVARGRGAFLRAVELFYLVLLATAVLVGALGAWGMDWASLVPREIGDVAGAFEGILPTLGVFSVGALACAFPREDVEGKAALRAPVWWCLAAALLCLLVTGTLGPDLTRELPLPFFLTLQGVGVPGGFQRLEALGTAVWVLSDLALYGMAALAGKALLGDRRWGAWPILAAGALGGGLFARETVAAGASWLFWIGLALGAGVPALLWCTRRGKK